MTKGVVKPEDQCGAVRRHREGEDPNVTFYCQQVKGYGTDHVGSGRCKHHGGNTPTGRKFAEKQLAISEAARLGLQADIDPQEALLQEVHRRASDVAFYASIVNTLTPDELTQTDRLPGGGTQLRPSVYVDLYNKAGQLLVQASQAAIRCGVAERQVRIAERQGELIATAVKAILQELGVLDHPKAAEVVRRELSAAGAKLYALPSGNIEDAQIIG